MDTTTKAVIARQMAESTGRHLLDSGGAYGRGWEQTQAAVKLATGKSADDLTDEELVELFDQRAEIVEEDDYVLFDLYHYLAARVEYDPEMDAAFREFAAESEEPWSVDAERFVTEHLGQECQGGYTYNFENALSRDVVYTTWTDEDDQGWVLLQVHNGCDARGGFTSPRAYKVDDFYFLTDCDDVEFSCPGRERPQEEALFEVNDDYYDPHYFQLRNDLEEFPERNEAGDAYVCPTCGGPLHADLPIADF